MKPQYGVTSTSLTSVRPLPYCTLHYITLHYIPLHYILNSEQIPERAEFRGIS